MAQIAESLRTGPQKDFERLRASLMKNYNLRVAAYIVLTKDI
jgi:hypothetical protein